MSASDFSYPAISVRELKLGDYFCLSSKGEKEVPGSSVWVRGPYDHSCGKFVCHKFSDVSYSRYFPGTRIVFQDFVF